MLIRSLMTNFLLCLLQVFVVLLPVFYLSNGFTAHWKYFWSSEFLKPPFQMLLIAASVCFSCVIHMSELLLVCVCVFGLAFDILKYEANQ